ncbi:MAG: DUF1269 domain-containing protein [Atopobiaceae bacterium]|nr:DUF1269 domain-containing protein [Atopobiaceae bacterium]
MENVVTAIFKVESEAYQAFSEISKHPVGTGYTVAEAALLKRDRDAITVADAFDGAAVTSDDTAMGMLVGSLVGILGGPLGVLLGAGTGALVGGTFDTADAVDSVSLMEVTAAKLFDGDVAIVALVQEEEPAFDAAFAKYDTTIIRHFAVDVMDEVDHAREAEAELAKQAKNQMRAERKAAKKEKREKRKAELKKQFEEREAQRKANEAAFEEASKIAEAEFASATKEMMGTE